QKSRLGAAAALAAVGAAHAADRPVKKAVPSGYVRVCSACGAGFFYIPGTDTCLRVSGRARFEGGYQTSYTRQAGAAGDTSGYHGRMRINLDARTQTAYGTLRAFTRLDAGARTGATFSDMPRWFEIVATLLLFAAGMAVVSAVLNTSVPIFGDWLSSKIG
ncbi:porin, partial [Methylobacterium sp. E-065]|uniref:porin n=1 Tax=Methylobacterium sp. E-065 TaxID=2836583 RepID=UPI001FB8DCA6